MRKTVVVARSPEEYFSTRPSFAVRLLNRKQESIGYRQSFATDRTRFGTQVLHAACHIEAEIEPEWVYFSVRQSPDSSVIFDSYGISAGSYAATILAGEFYSVMDAGYCSFVAAIHRDFLQAQEDVPLDSLWLLEQTRSFEIDREFYNNLVREMQKLHQYNYTSEEADDRIASIFVSALHFLARAEEITTSNRHRIVSRSIRYIKKSDISSMTPDKLAQASHCSIRTLQYAFIRTLGISAKKYINRYRLAQFRAELLQSKRIRGQRIADLAQKYGFVHGGNLSRDYRDLYGRLPSTEAEESGAQ